MLELITVKEYAKREKISDTATRKRLDGSLVQSIQLDNITYIVYQSKHEETIKDLRHKVKFQKEQIAKLKLANEFYTDQGDKIKELEIELKEYVIRERGLYEKVIGQFDKIMISQ